MSRYCGKCDLYDHFAIAVDHGEDLEKEINRTDIYINRKDGLCGHKLDIHTEKDLIPYYPYLISMSYGCKEGRNKIWITSESFVDIEEKERLGWRINDALKYYRKCKRKKIEINREDLLKEVNWGYRNDTDEDNYVTQIVDDIIANDFKYDVGMAISHGIHTPLADHYREQLFNTMVENGYEKEYALQWCYGARGLRQVIDEMNTTTN